MKLYRMTKNLNFEKDEKRYWKIFGEYPIPLKGEDPAAVDGDLGTPERSKAHKLRKVGPNKKSIKPTPDFTGAQPEKALEPESTAEGKSKESSAETLPSLK